MKVYGQTDDDGRLVVAMHVPHKTLWVRGARKQSQITLKKNHDLNVLCDK